MIFWFFVYFELKMGSGRYPLLRIFIAFAMGILWANFFHVPLLVPFLLFGVSTLVFLWITLFQGSYKDTKSTAFGVSSALFCMALGLFLSYWQSEQHLSDHYRFYPAAHSYHLRLIEQPTNGERSIKCRAEMLALIHEDSAMLASGKTLLYFERDSNSQALAYGDEILYRGQLKTLEGPQNPYEFDYRNYLNLQAVYAQAYLPSSRWKLLARQNGFSLKGWSARLRKHLLAVIDKWPIQENEKAVTKALLLGYRYDIDNQLLQAYSAAGATHVLAVSGLHVGIVYMLTYYLLFFMERFRHGVLLRSLILLVLLWAYALLTGLSPSVVRAATMFSFVAVGTTFKRPTSIYNTLLASAMLLLIIKPTYLFEVGFQLSYMAVLGIVWLQPKFESVWKPGNWALKQVWTITTVSLAAQIATFPLGLYYFHQFPTLFLVSNLLVIPMVTVLMYVGLVALILSASGWFFKALIVTYNWLLHLMNSSVEWIEGLRIFLIDQIHISRLELVLFYLFLGFGFTWLFRGGLWKLQLVKALAVVLLALQVFENVYLRQHSELTVYAMRDHDALSFMKGGQGVLVADSALLADEDAMTFYIRHHLWANNLAEPEIIGWRDDLHTIQFRKRAGLMCCEGTVLWNCPHEVNAIPEADVWLVNGESDYPPETENLPQTLVLSKTMQGPVAEAWQKWSVEKGVNISALDSGYFQLQF
ncbi:MAG TPA: hypothetical protein DCG19_12870 [Cryomorphaceae bacterium]|nr:hypothetical protein [Owenweeksia sp.]HAD98295.1 hypothetical protein [Cryomorphaceae bacterium]HBF21907.1 hypothetical protein [Cryomorphaceae bacterium]|tara:strand:+ start:1683 stop:3785 length:2103 start_codon:yes stop_codon:yes gene_type:complete